MAQLQSNHGPLPRKYGFGPFAQVTISNPEPVPYTQVSRDRHVIVLRQVEFPHFEETFTQGEFHDLVLSGKVDVDPHRFDEARQRVAALNPGVDGVGDLPARERQLLDFYRRLIIRVEEMRLLGETNLSDAQLRKAIGKAYGELIATFLARREGELNARKLAVVPKMPSPSTFREWRRDLIDAKDDLLALRDGRTARAVLRADRINDPETVDLMAKWVRAYLDRNRPTKIGLYGHMKGEFKQRNLERVANELPPLSIPSFSTFDRAVKKLPQSEVVLARQGPSQARRKHKLAGRHEVAIAAGDRLQTDNWRAHLATLKLPSEFWDGMPLEWRNKLAKTRLNICATVCVASKVVLGVRLSMDPNAETSLRTLEMACRDKTEIARAAGCRSEWGHALTPVGVSTDAGTEFDEVFRGAVRDLGALNEVGPTGHPDVRPVIERFFRTCDVVLMQHFTGRTGTNVVDKGEDYDPALMASVTVEVLTKALIRWIVDAYHIKPHGGLGGETPADAWDRLNDAYGVLPPPSPSRMRAVFGISADRKFGSYGIRFLGLDYRSKRLAKLKAELGDAIFAIKADPADLGSISVRDAAKNEWFSVPCDLPQAMGLTAAEWLETRRALTRKHAEMAALREDIVLEAMRDIRALGLAAAERAGIGPSTLSHASVIELERELFASFEIVPSGKRGRTLEGLAANDGAAAGEGPAAPSSPSTRRRGPGAGRFLIKE